MSQGVQPSTPNVPEQSWQPEPLLVQPGTVSLTGRCDIFGKGEKAMPIKDDDYNQARGILAAAGSQAAAKAHQKHTQGKGSPEAHGKQLLQAARDAFRRNDQGQAPLESGMTAAHHTATMRAATEMSTTDW